MKAPSRKSAQNPLMELADEKPGDFYDRAVASIEKALGGRGGATMGGRSSEQWETYLRAIIQGRCDQSKIGEDNNMELKNIAKSLNVLGAGALPKLADTLVQRFKAIEMKIAGKPELSEALQLVEKETEGLTSRREIELANKMKLRDLRLARGTDRLRRR